MRGKGTLRKLNHLDKHRIPFFGDYENEYNGAFFLNIKGKTYSVIASNGDGWEHVSVAGKNKTPTWEVMNEIKDLFFHEDEAVMQLHPIKDEYVNNHENCLHLWRPINEKIPTPPKWMVGIK